jgi:hypothetical protein
MFAALAKLLRSGKTCPARTRKSLPKTFLAVEALEVRCLMSAGIAAGPSAMGPDAFLGPNRSPTPILGTLKPDAVRHAYGFDRIAFPGAPADGRGQTIAIVDAFDDPNIASDLHTFDEKFNLPDPTFSRVNQTGGSDLPDVDPRGKGTNNWEFETAMDVEWAHAIAPGANILLVEANSLNDRDLFQAVQFAASQPGVSVVSMSWGRNERPGDTNFAGIFQTPAGHPGVTFVASAGDHGVVQHPATSPNVLSVGGTTLRLDPFNNIASETTWSASTDWDHVTWSTGGGVSQLQPLPRYQQGVVPAGTTNRATPDVAYDASGDTPFAVYDSYNAPEPPPTPSFLPSPPLAAWVRGAGTSAAAPQWAALIAIANQGRALRGLGSLDGASETLPLLYRPSFHGDFHDITQGGNQAGLQAGPGYDLVTGLGSPKADRLVPHLVNPGGQAPAAGNAFFSVGVNSTGSFSAAQGLLSFASDAEGDPMTARLDHGPAAGQLNLRPDGSFDYTPNANFRGVDAFTWLARDVDGDSTVATATIQVFALPVAGDLTYHATGGRTLTISADLGLVHAAAAQDTTGDQLTLVANTQPANGRLSVQSDGSFVYTPNATFYGTDSFQYQLRGLDGLSNWATVFIQVSPPAIAVARNPNIGVMTGTLAGRYPLVLGTLPSPPPAASRAVLDAVFAQDADGLVEALPNWAAPIGKVLPRRAIK